MMPAAANNWADDSGEKKNTMIAVYAIAFVRVK